MSVPARERLGRWLWGAAGLVVLVLVLKVFVADVYRVSSGSMRPTISAGPVHPGEAPRVEWVLVAYERGRVPERFDLVVWHRAGVGAVVKRVVGLPGESVQVHDGDLLVDGERLGPDDPRPAPVIVFDSDLAPLEDYFHFRGAAREGPWRRDREEWIVDARTVAEGEYLGRMSYHPELRDDYLDVDGRRVVGHRTINDAELECEFRVDAGTGRLVFELIEKADAFELSLRHVGGERIELEVVRRDVGRSGVAAGAGEVEVLERVELVAPVGSWRRLRFANLDDHLVIELEGARDASAEGGDGGLRRTLSYGANRLRPGRALAGDQHVGPRIELGAEGLLARFRSIRILRDLHYTSPEGGQGVDAPVHLGPDEVFLLGDNSAQSQDSRAFGPVPLEEIVGRPTHVLWPPASARRLVPRGELP